MTTPKYCIYRKTKERVEVVNVDFDKKIATLKGIENHTYSVPFKDIDFDYAEMDLDDMYAFLRALYSPSEVVKRMCDARNL